MILSPLLAFVVTLILTGLVRHFALRKDVLDHPNHRSLHASPIPRGGGAGIVLSVLAYVLYATAAGTLDHHLGLALFGGGLLIAGVGWADDLYSLSARARLAAHFVGALWAVWWIGGLPSLDLGFAQVPLGLGGAVAAVVLTTWVTNLYNFMDGIDGLAGIEAVFLAGGAGLLLLARGATSAAGLSFVVLGAALGFLYWNWAPARIFMGDAGSCFLGFTFAVLALWCENSQSLPIVIWFILGTAFFMDASITIVRRLRHGVWRDAHRTHAYQRAVISGLTHSQVTLTVAAFDTVLIGVAAVAIARPAWQLAAALTAALLAALLYLLVGKLQPFVIERPRRSA